MRVVCGKMKVNLRLRALVRGGLLMTILGAAARSPAAPPPDRPNALNVSWGDMIVVGKGDARLDTPEHIRAALGRWCRTGRAGAVYWRISSWLIERCHVHRPRGFEWYFDRIAQIEARCDPRAEALKSCRALGVDVYAYLTLFDEGSPATVLYGDAKPFPWQSRFTIEHPEYLVCDRSGKKRQYGVMEYAYPEVRRYKIDQILAFLDAYGYDGVYLCFRSHSKPAETADTYGFNEPVCAAFRKRFGVDIRTEPFDLQAWRDLRGEALTRFFQELRQALAPRGKKIIAAVPRMDIVGPPYGNMTLPWRTWVRKKLVDALVVGITSGNFHYPSERGRDRERGYLASADEHFGQRPLLEDLRERYAPLCRAAGVRLLAPGGCTVAPPPLDGNMIDAMALAGRSLFVYLDPAPAFDLRSPAGYAVDLWVRPESTKGWPRLLCKYNHRLGDEGRGWELLLGEKGEVVFRFAGPGFDRHLSADRPLEAGRWSHVAVSANPATGTISLEVNGETTTFGNITGVFPRAVPVPLALGGYVGGGRPLHGSLAGIRFWDRPVSFTARGEPQTPKPAAPLVSLTVTPPPAKPTLRVNGAAVGVVFPVGDPAAHVIAGPAAGLPALWFGPTSQPGK